MRAVSLAAALLLTAAPMALAQGSSGSGSATAPTVAPRGSAGDLGAAPGGVITPPRVDPGIAKPTPPNGEFPTRIIRPPGTPGGNTSVQPK